MPSSRLGNMHICETCVSSQRWKLAPPMHCISLQKARTSFPFFRIPSLTLYYYIGSETVKLIFSISAPIPEAPSASVGAGIGGKWHNEGTIGVYRCGSQPGQSFTTLYFCVSLGKKDDERRERAHPDPESLKKDT